jgi:hypothetical protein
MVQLARRMTWSHEQMTSAVTALLPSGSLVCIREVNSFANMREL